jgi:hypothetical protein
MAVTSNLGVTQLTEGQSQKEVTINTAFELFDHAIAGKLTKSIAGAVDVTLTAEEWTYSIYEFTGNTTADINIIVPTATRRFSVVNNTTGPPRTITIKTAAAPGVVLTVGEHLVVEQNGTTMIALTSGSSAAQPYDLGVSWSGTLPASQVLLRYPFPRAVTFPAGLISSQAVSLAPATGTTTLTLAKNGTPIGTINFAAAATSGTFTLSSLVSFVAGDLLTLTAPDPADATLADLGIALAGIR